MLFPRFRSEAPRAFTVFGKVPSQPDFIRIQAAHPAVLDLDRSLHDLMSAVGQSREFQAAFDDLAPASMLWRSRTSGHVFLGAWLPSRDASGRRYPLIGGLLLQMEEAAPYGPLLLLAGELLFNQLHAVLGEARAGAPGLSALQDYLEQQASRNGMDLMEPDLMREVLDRYMKAENALALGRLFPGGTSPTAMRRAILHLLFSGLKGGGKHQVLQVPLSPEVGHTMLQAGAWMDFLAALAPPRSPERWGQNAVLRPVHGLPGLLMHPGPPTADAVLELFTGRRPRHGQASPQATTGIWHRHPLYPEVSYKLDQFFTNRTNSMMDLKIFLGDTIRQVFHP